ncbi:glycosyltransferase family 2 protein [Clostridium sp. 19966]|uniref:glycosyltransferase family 2 protein n=1 Tax=Clostridium sp. 19966 TaxID=2768166 RepID=UPI0028EF98C9|nr:glycosyltransferase family 2 protein [Clostridium sp. 19966]
MILNRALLVLSVYYVIISFFGLIKFKDKKKYEPQKTFAMLVAAHNEEAVIKDIIDSLHNLDYPKELYDIFVIADNCTDKTAEVAESNGAIVCKRFNKEKRGKGYALEWMFDKLFKMEKKYDSVVILDADNLVSRQFLKEMNNKLCQGYEVVQGYLDCKNPHDTWITGSYSISFWTSNRMGQLARNNLGLSCQLGGTGACISTDLIKELGWGATCLTEDLEFTCKLVLNGKKVGWCHEARIYDEKPLTLSQSWWQRKRWMQGYADVSSRYFFKLLKRALFKREFTSLDCAIYSVQPIIFIITGVAMLMSFINNIANRLLGTNLGANNNTVIFGLSITVIAAIFGIIMQYIYTPFFLLLEKKFSWKILFYYIIYPVYFITWLPISIQGIVDKNKKEWSHTQHTRSVNIKDLEKAN